GQPLDSRGLVAVFPQRFGLPGQVKKTKSVNGFFKNTGLGDKQVIAFLAFVRRNVKTAIAVAQRPAQGPHERPHVTVLVVPDSGGNLLAAHPPAVSSDHESEGFPQLPSQVRRLVTGKKLNSSQNDDRSRRQVTPSGNVRKRPFAERAESSIRHKFYHSALYSSGCPSGAGPARRRDGQGTAARESGACRRTRRGPAIRCPGDPHASVAARPDRDLRLRRGHLAEPVAGRQGGDREPRRGR